MYIEVFLVGLLAGMSPGPDFFVVLRNSLRFGRHIGVATAIGIGSALMIHITYTVLGFAFLLHQHPALFRLVQGLGALYLFWLGYHAVKASVSELDLHMNKNTAAQPEKTAVKGFIEGFLCNALNPKATLFFLSVFSQFLSSGTQTWVGWVYALEIVIAVALWFTLLSCLITNDRFKRLYQRYSYWFDRILGAVLIFFAFKIFVSFFV